MTKVIWKKGVRLKIAVFVILAFLAFAVYGFCLIQRALKFEREHLAIRNLYQIHLAQKQFKSIQDR